MLCHCKYIRWPLGDGYPEQKNENEVVRTEIKRLINLFDNRTEPHYKMQIACRLIKYLEEEVL
jgi:hypothetical protein